MASDLDPRAEFHQLYEALQNDARRNQMICADVMSAIHEVLARDVDAIEVREDVHDRYAEHYQSEISQMVWAHWAVQHSHFKNPDGRVWTLSPWPIPLYWRWTRAVDLADYQLS